MKKMFAFLLSVTIITGLAPNSIAATNNKAIDKSIIGLEKTASSIQAQENKLTKLQSVSLTNFAKGIQNIQLQVNKVKPEQQKNKFIQRIQKLIAVKSTADAYTKTYTLGELTVKQVAPLKTGYDRKQITAGLVSSYYAFLLSQKQYSQNLIKIKDKAILNKLDNKVGKPAKQQMANIEPYLKTVGALLKTEKDLQNNSLNFYDSYQAFFNAKQKMNNDTARINLVDNYYRNLYQGIFNDSYGSYEDQMKSVESFFKAFEANYNNRNEEAISAFYYKDDIEYYDNYEAYKKIWSEGWSITYSKIKVFPITPDYSFVQTEELSTNNNKSFVEKGFYKVERINGDWKIIDWE